MASKAKESTQVLKARKKIKKQLAATEKRINPHALHAMTKLIEKQIARRSPERIALKNRQIVLFDENQHPAKTESKFVRNLLSRLKHPEKAPQVLGGRIKTFS